MTEGDIIRIGGVEYELQERWERPSSGTVGAVLKPKRKQTGIICRMCENPCMTSWVPLGPLDGLNCIIGVGFGAKWEPFYGKVVE